jgi:hypothetical protein
LPCCELPVPCHAAPTSTLTFTTAGTSRVPLVPSTPRRSEVCRTAHRCCSSHGRGASGVECSV